MALTWQFDLVGSAMSEDIEGGTQYTRTAQAKGIVATEPQAQLREVYDDPGLPAVGDALDVTNWPNLKLATRNVRLRCLTKSAGAEVTLIYRTFAGGFLPIPDDNGPVVVTSSDIALTPVKTPFDKDGNLVTVVHEADTKTPVIDTLIPVSSWTTFRVQETDPRSVNDSLAGTVNNALWNGYAARTVRFDGVNSTTTDGGDSFECTYRFAHRPDTWDVFVWYEDEDGKVPPTLVNGTGYKAVQRLKEGNFATLNITL